MKKTYQANINGQIFNIDDDAFELLNNYLEQLRLTFNSNESAEIVSDIESRICELLTERMKNGSAIVGITDVNYVIQTMGRPEDLGDENSQSDGDSKSEQRPFFSFNLPGKKRLYRNMQNKVFGGVFGGLATYLGWEANIMRVLYVVLAFCTQIWPMTILYLIVWMIMPAAKTPRQILEMTGDPVNLNSVGQAVMATSPNGSNYNSTGSSDGGFFVTMFTVIGKGLMAILGLVAGVISFACLTVLFCIIAGSITFSFFSDPLILCKLDLCPPETAWAAICATGCVLAAIFALFGLMALGAFAVVFNQKGASKAAVATTLIVSTLLFAAAAVLTIYIMP